MADRNYGPITRAKENVSIVVQSTLRPTGSAVFLPINQPYKTTNTLVQSTIMFNQYYTEFILQSDVFCQ